MSQKKDTEDIQESPPQGALYRLRQERYKLYQEIVKLLALLVSTVLVLAKAVVALGLL